MTPVRPAVRGATRCRCEPAGDNLPAALTSCTPEAAHFGRRGTVTLKATDADAVGGAVKVVTGNRVLAGGSAAGQLVVVKLRPSGSLDSTFGTRGQVVPALPGSSLDGVRALAAFTSPYEHNRHVIVVDSTGAIFVSRSSRRSPPRRPPGR